MIRRDFLAMALATPLMGKVERSRNFGWLPYAKSVLQESSSLKHLTNFGQSKVACLWKAYENVTMKYWKPRRQLGPDCVAFASAATLDILGAVQIVLKQSKELYIADTSTDMIYAGGRQMRPTYKGSGMRAEWVVGYLQKYGNLLRQEYGDHDLRPYSEETMRKWDQSGVPEELLKIANEHPLLACARVDSWEEFRDAVAAGYPVVFCASMGASNSKRDKDGFIRPRGTWYHSWCGAGVADGKRPGALLINSHGKNYGSGPKTHGQPDGSVWIDAKHIDKHCRNFHDSWAFSLYQGFPKPEEDYILW